MAHRGTAHARRRTGLYHTPFRDLHVEDGTTAMVSQDWDATSYDDVIPYRLRGTLVLDDDGDRAGLIDLVRDDARA